MTNSSIEARINQLRDLVYDGWQGNAREIATDYAYLLTKGGQSDLLDKYIAEFIANANEDDEEAEDYEDEG